MFTLEFKDIHSYLVTPRCYLKTHFDGKNHEKKEFQNSNVGGKQIENWCWF